MTCNPCRSVDFVRCEKGAYSSTNSEYSSTIVLSPRRNSLSCCYMHVVRPALPSWSTKPKQHNTTNNIHMTYMLQSVLNVCAPPPPYEVGCE